MEPLSNVTYVDFPRTLGLQDYEQAQAEFIEKYSTHPDVISIYSFGSVSHPGISDLDFIVVLNDRLGVPISRDFGFDFFDEQTGFILSHHPVLIPVEVFQNYWRVFPVTGLRLVYGEEIPLTGASPSTMSFYQVLNLIDVCSEFYPTIFLKLLHAQRFEVRHYLKVLKAFGHAIRLGAQVLGQPRHSWQQFATELAELWGKWFQQDNRTRLGKLRALLSRAAVVSVDLEREVDQYVREHLWECRTDAPLCAGSFRELGRYLPDHRVFGAIVGDFDVIAATLRGFESTRTWWRLLPSSFLLPLLEYANGPGDFSEQLRDMTYGRPDMFEYRDVKFRELVQAKGRLLNQRYQFYRQNQVAVPMLHESIPLLQARHTPSVTNGAFAAINQLRALKRRLQFCRKMKELNVHAAWAYPILY